MSVLLETSLGDLVIDLDTRQCPQTCKNFLGLCKAYKYNYLTFFSVQKGFLAQTGDPTNKGDGGQTIWSLLPPSAPEHTNEPYFCPDRHPTLKHTKRGTLSMACRRLVPEDEDDDRLAAGSQFFLTLGSNIDYLDGKHAPFGEVVEGLEKGGTLDKINDAFVDQTMRPLRDIRLQRVIVLDDPFPQMQGWPFPTRTPSPTPEQLKPIGLDASVAVDRLDAERPEEELEEERKKRDADAAALTLEIAGDLPFAEVRPPENILFVCKLNPVTRSEDLELLFSQYGKILSCEVIKDKTDGRSLQYAFIEFDEQESAERAYFKMHNVSVDDRRISVDFSQSVSKLFGHWNKGRAGGRPIRVSRGSAPRALPSSDAQRPVKANLYDFDDVPPYRGGKMHSSGRTREHKKGDRYQPYDRDDGNRREKHDRLRRDDENRTQRSKRYTDDRYRHEEDGHDRRQDRDYSRRSHHDHHSNQRHRHDRHDDFRERSPSRRHEGWERRR